MTYEDALNIYTDGSCLSNPRRGGIGIRYIVINAAGDEEWVDEAPPGYKQATNNELELMACIVALRGIPQSMGNPPTKQLRSEVEFSRNVTRGDSSEKIEVQ